MPGRGRLTRAGMTGLVTSGLAALLVACTSSSALPAVDPTTTGPALMDEVVVQRVEYPTRDRTPDPGQNWADLYLPAGEHVDRSLPLAVLIHGGAWQDQSGAEVFESMARELVSRGMAVYNIEYRRMGSGGGWPTTLRDVADALDHVAHIGEVFPQVTTEDEVVVGHSAGAQLAVWGGTRHLRDDDDDGARPAFRPTRVVSIAGPLDLVYAATHGDNRIVEAVGGAPHEVPERYAAVDPRQNIDPTIPVIAVHGTADTTVDPENSRRYVEAVRRVDGRARLELIEGEDHVSIVSDSSPAYPRVLDTVAHASTAELDRVADDR